MSLFLVGLRVQTSLSPTMMREPFIGHKLSRLHIQPRLPTYKGPVLSTKDFSDVDCLGTGCMTLYN